MKNFKIRIIKVSSPFYWYAGNIGNIFDVTGVHRDEGDVSKFSINYDGTKSDFFVDWNDCELEKDEFESAKHEV